MQTNLSSLLCYLSDWVCEKRTAGISLTLLFFFFIYFVSVGIRLLRCDLKTVLFLAAFNSITLLILRVYGNYIPNSQSKVIGFLIFFLSSARSYTLWSEWPPKECHLKKKKWHNCKLQHVFQFHWQMIFVFLSLSHSLTRLTHRWTSWTVYGLIYAYNAKWNMLHCYTPHKMISLHIIFYLYENWPAAHFKLQQLLDLYGRNLFARDGIVIWFHFLLHRKKGWYSQFHIDNSDENPMFWMINFSRQ